MSDQLRITHLVTNSEFAGTERYVADIAVALAGRGHQVDVVGGRASAMRPLFEQTPVTWRPGSDPLTALRSLRRGGRRDIVHSHMSKADFVALAAAPITGGRRVSTRHIIARRGYSPLAARCGRLVRRLLACELAVSQWTSDQLERPADRILVNGVAAQPDVTTPREHRVLIAQRLAAEKDTATALRAWNTSGLGARGWRLTVAGSGPEQDRLQALVIDLGIADSVDFAGWLVDVGENYRASAILLAPAPTEPCGLTVLEAMARGLPVVAAGSGGHLETVGRLEEARLFAGHDHHTAAAHLTALADDEDARNDYGRRLRELQRRSFTVDTHTDQLTEVYRSLLRVRRVERPRAT